MRSFLIILLSVSPFLTMSQNNVENCKLLIAALSDKATQKIFHFEKRKNIPIVIIDTGSYFNNCSPQKIDTRDLIISQDYLLLNPSQLTDTTPSYIFISGFYKNQTKYRIKFFYKWTGAIGFVELKKRGKKFVVSKSRLKGYL